MIMIFSCDALSQLSIVQIFIVAWRSLENERFIFKQCVVLVTVIIGFRSMIESIREIERALGTGTKVKQPSEDACHQKLGKSVVTRQKLTCGTQLTYDHLTVKVGQPVGWPPQRLSHLIGRVLCKDVDADETITDDVIG